LPQSGNLHKARAYIKQEPTADQRGERIKKKEWAEEKKTEMKNHLLTKISLRSEQTRNPGDFSNRINMLGFKVYVPA